MKISNLKYNPLQVLSAYDPTNTLQLRTAFANDMKKRFSELISVIRKSIVANDAFGLKMMTFQMSPIQPGQFAFIRSNEKLLEFMKWLQEQVDKGILTLTEIQQIGTSIENAWTNIYVLDSYKRGLLRARYELKKAGYDVPSDEFGDALNAMLNNPFHVERLGLLYTRVFSALKGITSEMDTQISRILAQGLADGDGPALLARKLVATINGSGMGDLAIKDSLGRYIPASRRAEMLARTEVIRAHHQATIQEYMNWRVEKVFVLAEIENAGDKRVCTKCMEISKNGPYTLEVAMNIIPGHTLCRCCAIPYIVSK